MVNITNILTLITALTNLFLGTLVFVKGKRKLLNLSFTIFAFITAIWVFSNFLFTIRPNLFFMQSQYALGILVLPVALIWIYILVEGTINFFKLIGISILGLSLSFPSYINGLLIKQIKVFSGGKYILTLGPYFNYYSVFIFLFYIFLLYKLIGGLRKSEGIKKLQLKYVLIGALGFGGISIAVSFILPFFGVVMVGPYDAQSSLIFVIFSTLAITKYHLFGIRVLLTELLVGIMGVVLVVLPFLMPTPNLKILTLAVFLLFLIFGYYLVNATHKEEGRREEAERMAVQERALRLRTERLTRARDQFILSSQHYFRTPLTSIIGFLEMVLDESYGKLPEKVKEKLGLTSRSVLELRKRIEESLDISQFQIRKGKGILSLEEVRVEDLIKNVIEELKPQAKEKNLYLEVSFPENPLPKMKLDKKRMFMVFVNLIDNGIKHTLKGGIKLFLEYLKDKNSILFSVKDTGIGIPKEELPFIGQMPFERGRKAKELTPLGKGIGLYLSRLVVEAHGGKLWAESEGIGKGSVFYIELPVK